MNSQCKKDKSTTLKRIFYIAISVLLLLLLCTSVKTTATPTALTGEKLALSELINTADKQGLEIVLDDASQSAILNATAEETASFSLPQSYPYFNVLYLRTATDVTNVLTSTYVRASAPNETETIRGARLADGRHMFVYLAPVEGSIRLDVLGGHTVTVLSMDAERVDGYRIGNAANLTSIIPLGALLLLLLLLEKRLGYYAWVWNGMKNRIQAAKDIRRDQGVGMLILHLLCMAVILAFLLFAAIDLIFVQISPISSILLATLAALAIAGLLVNACVIKKDARPAALVLFVLLILGTSLALTEPISMRTSWDDGYHFANSTYSTALITNGGNVPLAFFDFACENYSGVHFRNHTDLVLGTILHYGDLPTAAIDLGAALASISNLPWYAFLLAIPALPFVLVYFLFIYIAYIPGIVTTFFTGLLGADFIKCFLLVRLANLFGYAILTYVAVKRLKSGAYLFSAIALLPVCIFLGATFSCDWWITGCMLIGFAYFISILQCKDEKPTRRDFIIMITALALACGPKELYFFLMVPLLFIPKSRFSSAKSARLTKLLIVLIMLVIMLSFVLPMFLNPGVTTDLRGGSDVNSAQQISFILHNPFQYAKIALDFIKSYVSLGSMEYSLSVFAWLGGATPIYSTVAILTLLYCVFTDRTSDDRFKWSAPIRLIGLLVGFAQIVLIVTALYVSYTPVAYYTVNGCQYRYLIPLFPLMFYCLSPIAVQTKSSERVKSLIVFGMMSFAALGAYYNIYLSNLL